jgi:hypothetical protein
MLERLSALGRWRPTAALFAALVVSASSAVVTSAQQPARTVSPKIDPRAAAIAAPNEPTISLTTAQRARVKSQYGRMPLQFEENNGQAPAPIRFLSTHGAYEVAVTPRQLVVNLKGHGANGKRTDGLISMRLLGANPQPAVTGEQELRGKVNYFLGNDPKKWHTGVSTFSRVRLKEVYPGIDLVYYGNQKQLEYDFVLKPGVDPAKVRLDFTGDRSLRLQADGDLLLRAKAGEMRWKRPEVYQMIDGKRHSVAAHYAMLSKRKGSACIGFAVAQYDHTRPLVIDPILLTHYYDTLIDSSNGGANIISTDVNSLVADSSGNTYGIAACQATSGTFTRASTFGGAASSTTPSFTKFPANASARTYILLTKLDASGALVFANIISGSAPDTIKAFSTFAHSVVLDNSGNVYISGSTHDPNMPMAGNSYQTFVGFSGNTNVSGSNHNHLSLNTYIAKFNSTGSTMMYSSYFGGRSNDFGRSIAVTPNGNTLYISGIMSTCNNFPATGGRVDNFPAPNNTLNGNGFQTAYGGSFEDGFLARLDDTNSGVSYNNLSYITLIGGSSPDVVWKVVIDPVDTNTVYLAGDTSSSDLFHSLTTNGFQTAYTGSSCGWMAKVNTSLTGASSFKYGTYMGGGTKVGGAGSITSNPAYAMAAVGNGIVYVAGATDASDFPVSANALQGTHGGSVDNYDAYLVKIDTTATGATSKLYASFFGGSGDDKAYALAFDGVNVYMAGLTQSTDLTTTTGAIFTTNQGGSQSKDGFAAKFTETNGATHTHQLNFSTYVGTVSDEWATGIGVDSNLNVYLMGQIEPTGEQGLWFAKISANHPPVANAQSVTVVKNTATSITLTGSDADAGDSLTYSVVTNPAHGTLSGTAPNLTYTPTAGYTGADSFTFKINDGHEDSNVATVSITVLARPTANAQSVAVAHNTATAITLTGSDTNSPPLTPLTYAIVTSPAHGTLSGFSANTGAVTYTPTTNYSGSDSFTFTVTNSSGLISAPATVTLNVAAAAPTANAQSVAVSHNTAKAITLTGSDPNVPALTPLTFNVTVQPTHGTLTGTAPNLTYTPNAGYSGADSLQFTVTNKANITSSAATVTINVAATAPIANPQTVAVPHNMATGITLTGSDPNVPALTPLTFNVTVQPTHGTLTGTAPNLTYTPNAGYSGADSLKFTVTNTANITSSAATVTINVAAAATPTANSQTVAVAHNTATGITLTGSDPNTPPETLTYGIGASPAHGTLSGFSANTGAVTYTPNTGYSGADSFTFTVSNTSGLISAPATVTLTVAAAAPTANSQSVSTNQDTAVGITLTGSDPNNPVLTFTYALGTGPSNGSLSGFNANTGVVTYTPNAGYSGADSFQFTVTNSAGLTSSPATVSISVATTVTDVSGQVSISRGPFLYRRATGTYIQVLTMTNTGGTAISGPISCILTGLANATLANASGTTNAVLPAGRPFINVGGLAAGASANITLSFTKNGAGSITYTTQVMAGPGSR